MKKEGISVMAAKVGYDDPNYAEYGLKAKVADALAPLIAALDFRAALRSFPIDRGTAQFFVEVGDLIPFRIWGEITDAAWGQREPLETLRFEHPVLPMTEGQEEKLVGAFERMLRRATVDEVLQGIALEKKRAEEILGDPKAAVPDWRNVVASCLVYVQRTRDGITAASEGTGVACLVTKGNRAMTSERRYGNNFYFRSPHSNGHTALVADVCHLMGVSPLLVHRVFFYYRDEERLRLIEVDSKLQREGRHAEREAVGLEIQKIRDERRQIITDMLPFPEIVWMRQSGEGGTYETGRTRKRREPLDLKAIRRSCGTGSAFYHAQSDALQRRIKARQQRK